MWPSSYQSVTYCYQRDIRTQKSLKINPTSNFTVTKQLPVSYLLLPKRYKDTKIIENKSNIQFYSDQAVTYCYQRNIRTQKSLKINPTSNFTVTKQLPVSYLLLPKRYKDTKIINIKSNIQFYMWPSSYQSVTYCYQRDIRTQKSLKINPTSNFTVTKQLPVSYLLLPKRYKDTKIIENKSNIQFYSDQAVTYCYQRNIRTQKSLKINPTSNFTVTKQLPTVTKEI